MKNVADIYPLSSTQLGMLFHTLANQQSGVYVNQYVCKLSGVLDVVLFQRAWQQTLARHPVLRTAFLWEGLDEPLQVVRQTVELPWQRLDWQGMDETQQTQALTAFLERDRTQGFSLSQAPLLRLTLIQRSEQTYQLVWSSHHLLFDGWSLPLIWQDMLTFYAALRAEKAKGNNASQPATPRLPSVRPYRDYIAWQQQQDMNAVESFWQSQLLSLTATTPLPYSSASAEATGYRQHTQALSPALTARLNDFARKHRLTLNTLFQSAWALLLSHYSGEKQVSYGSVVSGRPSQLQDVEKMVGLFINTLPVSVDIQLEQALIPWLQTRQQQLLTLREYESTPLSDIQRWSPLPPGDPLFESIVVFENYPTVNELEVGFRISDVRYLEQSNYPLAFLIVPGEAIELLLLYDTTRFSAKTIERLSSHLELLLTAFVTQSADTLVQLPQLSLADYQQLNDWNTFDWSNDGSTAHDISAASVSADSALTHQSIRQSHRYDCIHQLIEQQAGHTPDKTAVVFGDKSITYAELNRRANQLAHELRSRNITPGSRVAICLNRSVEMVIAILAVLKAGAAYVPLDPTYPAARIDYCLRDTAPQLVITQGSRLIETPLADVLNEPTIPQLDISRLDLESSLFEQPSDKLLSDNLRSNNLESNLENLATPDDLAYIIYTSGSTGQPKGVMVSHRNLMQSTAARFQVYAEPVERFLLLSSVAFDSSVAGLFWTLCQGGALVIAPRRIEQDMQQLADLIVKQRITHTLCVPTLYSLLLSSVEPANLETLTTVIVAGEACSRSLAQSHHEMLPAVALYNEYGPSEASVWCTAYRIPATLPPGPIAIGWTIPNTQIYLLNEQKQPVPIGAVGEIFIVGEGVSKGYLNQPEKTEKAFGEIAIGNWGEQAETAFTRRIAYRTGDLGRYREDGALEWLGRCDRQVKIRGHRIELGEIEDALLAEAGVQEAAVVAQDVIAADIDNLLAALASLP
ncbi:MAG: amino acid adenylation domain-containing protein, partial [Cyanobacteria bacterium J06632_3]